MPRSTAKKSAPKPSEAMPLKKGRAPRAAKKVASRRTWSETPIWDQMVKQHGDPFGS